MASSFFIMNFERYYRRMENTKNFIEETKETKSNTRKSVKDKKIDFEVDGSQHWLDKKIIEHDKKRNQTLIDNGWTVIRMRWDNW